MVRMRLLPMNQQLVCLTEEGILSRAVLFGCRLKDSYAISHEGSVSKCEVYADYLAMCKRRGTRQHVPSNWPALET